MEASLTASALRSLREGDFAVRLPETDEAAIEFNRLVDRVAVITSEIRRVCVELAEGKFGGQIDVPSIEGDWDTVVTDVNRASRALTIQIRTASLVVAKRVSGDVDTTITAAAEGETRLLFDLINSIGRDPVGLA